jgi:hypothetical protein
MKAEFKDETVRVFVDDCHVQHNDEESKLTAAMKEAIRAHKQQFPTSKAKAIQLALAVSFL